jgi:serine/threonine protein kinase
MIGSFIGGCKLLEVVGEGGFGTVYKAEQVSLDRIVAVKLLQPSTSVDSDPVTPFADETRLTGKLEHPNIVRTHYYGCEVGIHYVVMEYVEGETLDKVLSEDKIASIDTTLTIAKQIASALGYAHRHGVVHGDLNPRNIIIAEDGRPVLGDFLEIKTSELEGRSVVGVPEYVSPEHARGLEPTPKSDMYCLGIILYEMLTGKPPFSENDPSDTLFHHISDDPTPPSKLNKLVPAKLNKLVLRLLAKSPEVRPENCETVAKDLESLQIELKAGKVRDQKRERNPVSPALVVLLALVLSGLGATGYLVQRSVTDRMELDAIAAHAESTEASSTSKILSNSIIAQYYEEMRKGQILLDQKKFRSAAMSFHKACKLRPEQIDPRLCLATVFIEMDNYNYAKNELDSILMRDPNNREARTAMTYVQSKLQQE